MKRFILSILSIIAIAGSFITPAVVKSDNPAPTELIDLRTENSKTTDLGNGTYALDSSIGAIHYKDNYTDSTELWKDIDLTMVDGKVTKAPYELTIDGLNVTVRDKKTGSITTLELSDIGDKGGKVKVPKLDITAGMATAKDIAPDTDLEITWENSRITYSRILKSDKASTIATYNITQTGTGIMLSTKAVDSKLDADKSVVVVSGIKDGKLTEYVDTSKTTLTYPVKIDPTLDILVNASTDDCVITGTTSIVLTSTALYIGKASYTYGSGFRFTNVTVDKSAAITVSYITLTAKSTQTGATCNSLIYGEDADDAATYSTYANYAGRSKTNSVDWSVMSGQNADATYNTPSLIAPVQTIVDRANWVSGNAMAFQINNNSSSSNAFRTPYAWDSSTTKCASLHIEYLTTGLSIVTLAATSIAATTATANSNIPAMRGGIKSTVHGVQYGTNSTTYGAWDNITADITSAPSSWTDSLTSLNTGTLYYYRSFATDNQSTPITYYGSQLYFLTLPAAPTNVSATDGTYTNKVTITWTRSTGATKYIVYRDAVNASGTLGNVASYDDTGGGAPIITPGTASATDGSYADKVTLTVSGQSVANGTSYNYTVVGISAVGGVGATSSADSGYRGTTTLTYDWYKSASTTDDTFSAIGGATTNPYDDSAAPAPLITAGTTVATDGTSSANVGLSLSGTSVANGASRYYYCVISMTGATNQNTTHDNGYRVATALGYQWQRSSGTGDSGYGDIGGATASTYNDTGGAAPLITKGAAVASDGSSTDYVSLSLSGTSVANGEVRYYKCTLTSTGASNTPTASVANDGYRVATALTYQWNRSAADSDANYSTIGGATTSTYNDTAAPENGDHRYYTCTLVSTDASNTPQTATADSGYRQASAPTYDITNAPTSKAFGIIAANSTYYAKGAPPNNPVVDGDCTYTITNTGNVPIDISITGNNYTGGVGWTLGANAGADTVKMVAYKTGDNPAATPTGNGVVLTTSGQAFISNLAAAGHTHWDFSLITGTFTDGVAKSTTIRLTSTVH